MKVVLIIMLSRDVYDFIISQTFFFLKKEGKAWLVYINEDQGKWLDRSYTTLIEYWSTLMNRLVASKLVTYSYNNFCISFRSFVAI